VNLAVGPLVAAAGAKWKGYRMDDERDPEVASASKDPGALENALAAHGFAIRDEPAPPPPGGPLLAESSE
jgi:hypothetical protein